MSAISYLHLTGDEPPPALPPAFFKAVIIADCPVSGRWRDEVTRWLVRSGCLYAVAWGKDCEGWHDSIDDANLREFEWGAIPDNKLVMTTWHDNEPLSEAMWFAAHNAEHPVIELTTTIILHIAVDARGDELLGIYRAASAA